MEILISLSKSSGETISVHWHTEDDTAIAGIDYIASSGEAIFQKGETQKAITVPVIDRQTSNKRKFLVLLDAPINATIKDAEAECSIVPVLVNGPLVKSSLITNAYNNQLGRGVMVDSGGLIDASG